MLLVNIDNLLHFVITAQEDSATIVDMLGDHGHHPPHLAVDCLATSCCLRQYPVCEDIAID